MNAETTTSERIDTEIPASAPSAAETAGSRAAALDLAPPFYRPWIWGRPYKPDGFWIAHRHFDDRGELVLQLGRDGGGGGATVANSYLRFEANPAPVTYTVRFEPISLSRRPNLAGAVSLRAFLEVNGRKAPPRELHGGPVTMSIQTFGQHVFRVGFEVELKAGGTYGEVIGKIAEVEQEPLSQARSEVAFDGEPSLDDLRRMLEASDGGRVEPVELGSLKDVVTAGAGIGGGAN